MTTYRMQPVRANLRPLEDPAVVRQLEDAWARRQKSITGFLAMGLVVGVAFDVFAVMNRRSFDTPAPPLPDTRYLASHPMVLPHLEWVANENSAPAARKPCIRNCADEVVSATQPSPVQPVTRFYPVSTATAQYGPTQR